MEIEFTTALRCMSMMATSQFALIDDIKPIPIGRQDDLGRKAVGKDMTAVAAVQRDFSRDSPGCGVVKVNAAAIAGGVVQDPAIRRIGNPDKGLLPGLFFAPGGRRVTLEACVATPSTMFRAKGKPIVRNGDLVAAGPERDGKGVGAVAIQCPEGVRLRPLGNRIVSAA